MPCSVPSARHYADALGFAPALRLLAVLADVGISEGHDFTGLDAPGEHHHRLAPPRQLNRALFKPAILFDIDDRLALLLKDCLGRNMERIGNPLHDDLNISQ